MPKFVVKDKIKYSSETYLEYPFNNFVDTNVKENGINIKYKEAFKVNDFENITNLIGKKIKIENVKDDRVLLKFKGISFFCIEQINNTNQSILISEHIYVDHNDLSQYSPKQIVNKVLVVDHLSREMVYIAKALKARAIFTNSIDYNVFIAIKDTDLPVQVFAGFGKIPFDQSLKQLIVDHSKQVVLDFNYKRMLVSKHNLDNLIQFEIEF